MEPLVELYINSGDTLDIDKNFGIGIQYTIDDIRNIEKRNTAYSKTIILPGTKKNNFLLGNLFDINSDFSLFNPNIKTKCQLIRNGTPIIDGFLQLRNIIKHNEVDLQGNRIEYNVVIFDKQVDFYTKIENKKLNELDFSDFNHNYIQANIENSWNNNWKDVYVYPLLFNGNEDLTGGDNVWSTTDFTPAIFHKSYLQQIGEESQFEFGGDFWNNLSEYEREIIPFNGEQSQIRESSDILINDFRVGLSGTKTFTNHITTKQSLDVLFNTNNFIRIKIPFDEESPLPNFDTNNNFNTSTNRWELSNLNFFANWDLQGEFIVKLTVTALDSSFIWNADASGPTGTGNYVLTTNTNVDFDLIYSLTRSDLSPDDPVGIKIIHQDFITDFPRQLLQGDSVIYESKIDGLFFNNEQLLPNNDYEVKLDLKVKGLPLTQNIQFTHDDMFITPSGTPNLRWKFELFKTSGATVTKLQSYPLISDGLTEGETVDLNSTIPKKLKQSDIIDDLVKRYNLYIKVDPDNDKKLLLFTRNQFYSGGTTLDWTDKKEYDIPDEIEFLPELQNKEILFSYTPDEDKYNEDYTKRTNDIYGEKRIIFDNQFVKGEKKIQSPFSPTPLIKNRISNTYSAIVPAIKGSEPKNKPRILYYNGLINTIHSSWGFFFVDPSFGFIDAKLFSTYPYAGHFDNPLTPTLDINFGETDFLYYNDTSSGTTNNLFNRYWRNYIEQIAEGKLITSMFDLNESDINFIKNNMNTKIFIKESYHFINKIIDYDPTKNKLTKVELLKIIDGVEFIGEKKKSKVIWTPSTPFVATGAILDTSTHTNKSLSDDGAMIGKNNKIGEDSNSIMIIGSGNTVDTNTIDSGIIGGNDNYIGAGIKNSWIIGTDNKIVERSNEFYIGDIHIIDGKTKVNYNIVDGNASLKTATYSDKKQNLIDGGQNKVREIDWTFEENLIDGGQNKL